MSSPTPQGLAHRVLRQTLTWFLPFAVLAGFATLAPRQAPSILPSEPTPAPVREVESRVELLLERHDCWTKNGPDGVIPGHAVVTIDGRARHVGDQITGQALEQLFDGADHGLVVHGFCR